MDAHHSDRGCWAARGKAAQEESDAVRTSARGFDGGDHAKQARHGGGAAHLGGVGAGSGGAKVRLLRLGRFGRHPHGNEILCRTSTPEDLEYLRTETPPHLRQPPSS